jgi:hydroxymethylpyrimidine/phosphomethylpyrimidine kinase
MTTGGAGETGVQTLRLLTIGGSDPTGGAGIQADLKTFAVHGVYGLAVVTALIAGDTTSLRSLHTLPADFVADQLDAVLGDIGASAVKTGLLGGAAVIEAVGALLRRYRPAPLVIDPVLVAKTGTRILDEAARLATVRHLLPLATVATPNVREAAALSGRPVETVGQMEEAARAIRDLGPRYVVVKGRGLPGPSDEVVDVLYDGATLTRLAAPRVPTNNIRGTGCTLSAALAVQLARGRPAPAALAAARGWVIALLRASAGLAIGHGVGPLDHTAVPAPD